MEWYCKTCGYNIENREDKRKVKVGEKGVYIVGYCENCLTWTILDIIPKDVVKKHIRKLIDE